MTKQGDLLLCMPTQKTMSVQSNAVKKVGEDSEGEKNKPKTRKQTN